MKYTSLLLATGLLTGCSGLNNVMDVTNLIDYSDNKSVKVLEIPADLNTPDFDKTYLAEGVSNLPQSTARVSDRVPLVDSSMGGVESSQVNIVARGSGSALQIDGVSADMLWKRTNDALKVMGMTIAEAQQASGSLSVRDRANVSDGSSPIGALLNRSLGRLNQGQSYKVKVESEGETGFVSFTETDGRAVAADKAKSLLDRLQKAYSNES